MSETDSDHLVCPECGESLDVDEEWLVTDRTLIGTAVAGGESIQGDYAHARCLAVRTEQGGGSR